MTTFTKNKENINYQTPLPKSLKIGYKMKWKKFNLVKLVLQIGAALFYYKLEQMLLQTGAAWWLQIGARVVTN